MSDEDFRFQVVPPCGGHHQDIDPQKTHLNVSSRAPVWGASSRMSYRRMSIRFQVVPPCGGHLKILDGRSLPRSFKSCPRVGGIVSFKRKSERWSRFQVVPPCGGHHSREERNVLGDGFQVVPPCGGHLGAYEQLGTAEKVSSRAPVWGASAVRRQQGQSPSCFKSCPRVGGICNFAQKACC